MKIDAKRLAEALDDLRKWVPEGVPEEVRKDAEECGEDPTGIPFFTEAFLYPLLGKEDARSLLGRMRRLCDAAGIPGYRVHQ